MNGLVDRIVTVLYQESANVLPDVCERYGLDEGNIQEAFRSKTMYIERRLKNKDQLFLLDLSNRIIEDYGASAEELSNYVFKLSTTGLFEISEITRKNILNELYCYNIEGKQETIINFLKRIWNLTDLASPDWRYDDAEGYIWQHMINNHDFGERHLFEEYLGVLTATDQTFKCLVEQVVHPSVRDGKEQTDLVNKINKHLSNDGYELGNHEYMSGYPVFKVQEIKSGVKGPVKNLIFAAIGSKPNIVLSDSLNNDIKIVGNDNCLIYEKPISTKGLYWSDLVKWWGETNPSLKGDRNIKNNLYDRLLQSLDSPPEIIFFNCYITLLKGKYHENIPALIPQVYLHYDPYTKKQRGGQPYLSRQRMDFLLILPNKQRVVIEIDGKQHYSVGEKPSPKIYADMVSADREIKLQGYEVYRFGGYELMGEDTSLRMLESFFDGLFSKHGIDYMDSV